ncbi:MAG: hypothetical protein VB912_09020 [Pirellulaceae bacterium]
MIVRAMCRHGKAERITVASAPSFVDGHPVNFRWLEWLALVGFW